MNSVIYLNDDILSHVLSHMDALVLSKLQQVNKRMYVLIFYVFKENMSRICESRINGGIALTQSILDAKQRHTDICQLQICAVDRTVFSLHNMHQVLQVISESQKSFCTTIENRGVPCPRRPLTLLDLRKYNIALARADLNLQRCWSLFQHSFFTVDTPAAVDHIRPFMRKYMRWPEANKSLILHGQMHQGLDSREFAVRVNLSQIPGEINLFSNLRVLTITGHSLVALYPGQFAHLTQLTDLDLSDNGLRSLPEDVFRGLKALNMLYLDRNGLTELPENLFRDQGELLWINLKENALKRVPRDLFAPLRKLLILILEANELIELSPEQFAFQSELAELNLSENRLTDLPAGVFAPLKRLMRLDLSENQLKQLSDGFSKHEYLRDLDLVGNKLRQLPKSLFQAKELKVSFDDGISSSEEDSMDAEEICKDSALECRLTRLFENGTELESRLTEGGGILHLNISDWIERTERDRKALAQVEVICIGYIKQLLEALRRTRISSHALECMKAIPPSDESWKILKQCLEEVDGYLAQKGIPEDIKSLEKCIWNACESFFLEAGSRARLIQSLTELAKIVIPHKKRERESASSSEEKPSRKRSRTL
jgi:Leucine-rich repeat (LRR) protein